MSGAAARVADRFLRQGSRTRVLAGLALDRVLVPLGGSGPPGLRRGRVAEHSAVRRGAEESPVVLVVVLDAQPESTAAVVERVADAQALGARVTPVFVVDRPVLAVLRRAGYAVELLPPGGDAALARRLVDLRVTYATDAVVVVPAGAAPPSAALLLGLFTQRPLVGSAAVARRIRTALQRLEGWFDPPAPG